MAVRFGPTIVFAVDALLPPPRRPHQNKTETTAKVHSEEKNAPHPHKKSPQLFSVFFFFLRNGRLKKTRGKKKTMGKCAAIKKPSVGRVFEFSTVLIYVGKEKKTLFFSVTSALCHFNGTVDVSLRVQYLHLHR